MLIEIKKKGTLIFNKFKCKCAIGKSGTKLNKIEGDKATPKGVFSIDKLYYRKDRIKKIKTKLKKIIIKKGMGWCHDSNHKKYNKEINLSSKIRGEKLYRKDHKYDLMIPIKYNQNPTIKNKGSAIFLHLTKNYNPTLGCIALKGEKFIYLLKTINNKTKIKIY